MKKLTKRILLLFFINIILVLLYLYYQPLCEPCLNTKDCPFCISEEQYFIVSLFIIVNMLFITFRLLQHKIKFICACFLIFASGCKEKESKAVFVEVYYVSPYHLYPMNIGCSRYVKSGSSNDEMFSYMKIYDRYLEEFNRCYNELESGEASNYNFDARIQMLVHQHNYTDTVCMNKSSHIVINGIEQKNGDKLFKLMNSLIEKDLKSKNHK